jgi:acyl-CoA hydrolase
MAADSLTLAEAAALLRPGMTVFIHGTATEPRALVEYIAANPGHLAGVHLLTSFIPGINTVLLAGVAPGARLTTFMAQPGLADAIAAGEAEALRLAYSRIPAYLDAMAGIDLAFVHGRTLADGSVSTGVSGELIPSVCAKAQRVCLIDNPAMPVPARGCTIAADRIDYRVASTAGLVEYRAADRADAVTAAIARHVAGLIHDGDTLQSGLGVIPNAVFALLGERRRLRVYSGMISDSIMPLAASGALAQGVEHVYGMALGSHELFRWLDQRPGLRVADVVEAHDVARLSRIERLVGINSGLEVALDGSVNAERIGTRVVSGPGGLPDFSAGSSRSPGGRSIVALPAANMRKGISRIVARLAAHEQPTIPAGVVTHVVTEHGVAEIRGATAAQCAERLIGVADPAYRDALSAAASLTH